MYVALGKDVKENKSIMRWASENSEGKKVCTLHVHQPVNKTPADRKTALEEMAKKERLGQSSCFSAWKHELYIEADSIEKGIIQLVEQHNIGALVIGAAANEHYSRKMKEVKSKKAIYVRDNAPSFCNIMFICNGYLIHTRGAMNPPELSPGENAPSDLYPSQEFAAGHTSQSRNESETEESIINDHYYVQLEHAMIEAENSRRVAFEESIRCRKAEKEALRDAISKAETADRLYNEELRLRKATEEELAVRKEEIDIGKEELEFINKLWNKVTDELRETTVEKFSLQNLIEKSDLSLKESEEKLLSAMELLEKYKNEHEESEDKLFSAVELLQMYKNEQEELQIERNKALKKAEAERNKALKEAEKLRKQIDQGPSSSTVPAFISVFSYSDLEKATNHFDPYLKIGEGGYGSIYKGFLRHTEVAIKILNPNSAQGPREFDQEVAVLSKLRHPNLITLFGACQESCALVYEYLPGGNLEDRLSCKNNTLPLPWQIRIRIATELCTALIFLHTSRPGCIIHGDLKPSNVLLDDNCVCKLADFGICRVVPNGETSMNQTTFILTTQPKGTFTYIDPEFLSTGELTPKSDVYSYGIILLQLLTGKSALGISKEVQSALSKGTLSSILDTSAGDWPFVQAERLARIGLRCCDMRRKNRPDLISNVWRILEPMKASCQRLSTLQVVSDSQPPNYFICPISQEIMEDPHIASDGFTYEAKTIRGWLNSDHDSSPMTNMTLANHNLIPNRALRSAIQEWLQHNRSE